MKRNPFVSLQCCSFFHLFNGKTVLSFQVPQLTTRVTHYIKTFYHMLFFPSRICRACWTLSNLSLRWEICRGKRTRPVSPSINLGLTRKTTIPWSRRFGGGSLVWFTNMTSSGYSTWNEMKAMQCNDFAQWTCFKFSYGFEHVVQMAFLFMKEDNSLNLLREKGLFQSSNSDVYFFFTLAIIHHIHLWFGSISHQTSILRIFSVRCYEINVKISTIIIQQTVRLKYQSGQHMLVSVTFDEMGWIYQSYKIKGTA